MPPVRQKFSDHEFLGAKKKHIVAEKDGVLHDLVDLALSGEDVVIMRDGCAFTEIRGLAQPLNSPEQDMLNRLREFRSRMPRTTTPAGDIVSQMRDESEK